MCVYVHIHNVEAFTTFCTEPGCWAVTPLVPPIRLINGVVHLAMTVPRRLLAVLHAGAVSGLVTEPYRYPAPPCSTRCQPVSLLMAAKDAVPRAGRLSPWTVLKGAVQCRSFHDFMVHVRSSHGDCVKINLQPVLLSAANILHRPYAG